MPDLCHYVVLSTSGQNVMLGKGAGEDYFKLLLDLAHVWSGPTTQPGNKPDRLLRNGEIVVADGLLAKAVAYRDERDAYIAVAEQAAKDQHMPPWLETPED